MGATVAALLRCVKDPAAGDRTRWSAWKLRLR